MARINKMKSIESKLTRSDGATILRDVDTATGELHLFIYWPDATSIESLFLDGAPITDNKFNGLVSYQNFNQGIKNAQSFTPKSFQAALLKKIEHDQIKALPATYFIIKFSKDNEPSPFSGLPDVTALIKVLGNKSI